MSDTKLDPPVDQDVLWTASEITRCTQRNQQATYRLLRLGRLPATRIGDRWVASVAKLKRALTGEQP
jgi:hypothetical protein